MAWTAKITDKSLSEGRLTVTVELSNGKDKFGERFTISNAQGKTWLKDRINERINTLDSLSTYADSLSLGNVDLTPTLAPEVKPPTQEELDQAQFARDYEKYIRLQKAFDAGLVKQTRLDAQAAIVKAAYKDEYIDILG